MLSEKKELVWYLQWQTNKEIYAAKSEPSVITKSRLHMPNAMCKCLRRRLAAYNAQIGHQNRPQQCTIRNSC